jgi:hypothetical protein
MSTGQSITSAALREKLDAAERACRAFSDACFAAWDSVVGGGARATRDAHLIMDGCYIATATSRVVAHWDAYQLHMVAMQVAVCRRAATRCAQVNQCAAPARACALACAQVLQMLWDGSVSKSLEDELELQRAEDDVA